MKFQLANQQFTFYREVHDAERLAEELYVLFMVDLASKKGVKERNVEILCRYSEQLLPLMQKFDSYLLHLYGRLIGVLRHKEAADFGAALKESEDAINFFLAKPFDARGALQIFYYEKLTCHIQLRQLSKGRETASRIQRYLKTGTFNWFKVQELFVSLSMASGEYQLAADTVFKVSHQLKFEFLPDNNKEIWRVFEAYVYLLIAVQKVNKPSKFGFKLGRFINETTLLSKEKSGMNVAIKVVRLLILLAERKYNQVLEETESLEQYCYRYLKEARTQRGFYFLKMLLQIPAGQFDVHEVDKKTQKYLQKLSGTQSPVGMNLYETEIIPYEQLWPMAMSLLSTNK